MLLIQEINNYSVYNKLASIKLNFCESLNFIFQKYTKNIGKRRAKSQ